MIAHDPGIGRKAPATTPPPADAAARNGGPPLDVGEVVATVRADLTRMGRDAVRLLRLRGYRTRARIRRAIGSVIGAAALAVGITTLAIIAAVFVMFGLAGALTELAFDGHVWAGRLGSGILGLAAAGAFVAVRRARSRQTRLTALRRVFERRPPRQQASQ